MFISLPPYTPNLNPIERLWKVPKSLKKKLIFFQSTLPETAHSLTSRINDNFQMLNPASLMMMGIESSEFIFSLPIGGFQCRFGSFVFNDGLEKNYLRA